MACDTFDTGTHLNPNCATTWTHAPLDRATSAQTSLTCSVYPTYFQYDANGQLTNACQYLGSPYCWGEYGSAVLPAYAYDAAGNRSESWAQPTQGPGNRLLRFKNYALSYDRNGNDTLKAGLGTSGPWTSTDTTRMAWNALGQLVRVERWNAGGAHTVDSLFYDALGRRVAKKLNSTTTWYVYDGDQVVMDVTTGSTLLAEYAYLGSSNLLGMRTPSDTLVAITTPPNGTVVGLARARDGAEMKRYPVLNTPWSQQQPDTGLVVRFRMGGQEYDQETGLYHLGARYYDPQLGRFLSEDPIGIAGGLNLYAYAGNDPVNRRDPSGLDGCYVLVHIHWEYDPNTEILSWTSWISGPFCPGAGGGGGDGGVGGRPNRGSLCTAWTLAGSITVDASIASDARHFLNQAVMAGIPVDITSSFRATAEQASLYDRRIATLLGRVGPAWEVRPQRNPVAPPGTSRHESGFSIDVNWDQLSAQNGRALVALASEYGFAQLRGDMVHFQAGAGDYGAHGSRSAAIRENQAQYSSGRVPACGI